MLNRIDPTSVDKPIRYIEPVAEPIRTCATCGKQVPSSYAISIILTVGSPGHPSLAPFQGPGSGDSYGDYWACSVNCWQQLAHKAIDEHMLVLLNHHRSKVGL